MFLCRCFTGLASEAVHEEIRQLQFGIHPKFSISCGNELAPITAITDAVQCKHTPSKYRIQGIVVGHWPPNIAECITQQPNGELQYAFKLRLARNARDPAHVDVHVLGGPAVSFTLCPLCSLRAGI